MKRVMIRPDLRTAGGEVCDILCGDRYAGTLTLVYREGKRMNGAVLLEEDKVKACGQEAVLEAIHQYVESLIEALHVAECEVIVSIGELDRVIATEQNVGTVQRIITEPNEKRKKRRSRYELVVIGDEGDETMEYHIYEGSRKWIAEAILHCKNNKIRGEVIWRSHYPDKEEIAEVTDLIIDHLDTEEVEKISLDIKYGDESVETMEIMHGQPPYKVGKIKNPYKITLVRDDGDVLTYDIFRSGNDRTHISRASIDITTSDVTGSVEMFEKSDEDDREEIATLLLLELEKERDYDTVNLSFMYKNEPIDEIGSDRTDLTPIGLVGLALQSNSLKVKRRSPFGK